MTHGSQQLRLFRRAIRDGATLEAAAELAGMSIGEARLIHAEDLKFPPPPAAFELLYDPDAPVAASDQAKDDDMARGRMAREPEETADHEAGEGGGINGEYARPNAAIAFDIYDKQIAPKLSHLATLKGDLSQPYDDIKEKAHFPRKVLNFIVALENEEDAKRDHLLFALSEGLKHRKLFLPRDLVTMASGDEGGDVVPTGEAERGSGLATLDDDDDESGMFGGDDDFDEASDEELAAQEGRGAGTSTRAAMKRAVPEASAATH